MASLRYPDGASDGYGYDANDNQTSTVQRDGTTATMSYDAANRLVTVSRPNLPVVTLGYDLIGRLRRQATSDGSSGRTLGYDGSNHLVTATTQVPRPGGGPVSLSMNFGYDAAGNRTSATWPDGSTVTWSYDGLARVSAVKDGGYTWVGYGYDPLSRKTGTWRGPSSTAAVMTNTYGYDAASHLTFLGAGWNGGAINYAYAYDGAGQLTSTTVDNDGFLSTVGATQSYGTANALNGYSSVNGNAYGYDGRGNVTTAGALIAMSYDSRNMLTRYAQGGTVQSMGYYPEGGRAWKQLNGVTTLTFEALGVEWGDYDVNGNLVRRYVRSTATGGPGGGDVMGWVDSSGARSLAVHDRQGSVVTVLNASGQSISAYYAYNDFGQSAQDGQTGSPYRYAGMRYDEIGLYVTPNRTYVPGIGRWLQMDPSGIKDGLNRYAYVGNDPLSQYDPLGLQAMGVWVPEGPLPVYLPPELAPGSPQGIQAGNVLAGNITQGLANLGNFAQSVPDRIIAGGIAGALMLNKAFSDKEGEGPQVNPNKQGKHQPGHRNFQPGKSELTHPDPQELVDKGAGTGQQVGSTPVGDAGSKERVDFGENIGTHVDPVTGDRNPTDIGIIHYGKDDVHIVPARPNPY